MEKTYAHNSTISLKKKCCKSCGKLTYIFSKGRCKDCNEYKDGNLAEFTKRLEAEHPGITDILKEEAAVYYRISRSEVQGVITEARVKVNELIKKIVA